jgi:DME family drug/metabolite transporter
MLWGTTGTAQAFAPAGAHPVAVGAVRLAVGGLALLLLAAQRGGLRIDRTWPRWPTITAAASMAFYQLCFFAGVARTGVAVGTVVTIGSAPILAGVLAWLLGGERPTGRWWAATLCAITGCILLVLAGNAVSVDLPGITLALGAGASYAVYALASKTLLAGRSPDAVVAVVFCGGALLLAPVLFFADLAWLAQPGGWLVALHLGLLATAAAYALFARGLILIPVATAVTLTLMEPLTAGVLGVVVLGEQLTLWAALGVLLLLGGLAILALQPGKGDSHLQK